MASLSGCKEGATYISDFGEKNIVIPAFSTPCKPEPEVYYGVYTPDCPETLSDQDFEKVYTDKVACLTALKKCKGSRFKNFATYEEALHFAENGPVITHSQSFLDGEENRANINNEKPSPYRGPKSQELVKFRKAIEKNDMTFFEQCLEENPRYAVSSGDTPAILQEGSRYNALHVACRTDKPQFVSKILTTVANTQFFQKLYPDDTLESSERRSKYLLDAYLNTPDKGLNETPLHFASKHGSVECVRILTSYPDCCKARRNKFNQTPLEIVGSRAKSISNQDTEAICRLLGEHYYVPLLRDDDLCLLPQIGEPWSPKQDFSGGVTEEQQLLACLSPGSSDSPLSPITPTLKVRGYAGPMSWSQADNFYRRWRETGVLSPPTRSTREQTVSLRLTDHEKGLERVGRDLAHSVGHVWNEYWDFLGEFTNIASDEGLFKLEKYLKNRFKEMATEQNDLDASALREKLNSLDLSKSTNSPQPTLDDRKTQNLENSDCSVNSHSTMGDLCQELEALRLNASLSPSQDTSGQPFKSASSKFLQTWRDQKTGHSTGQDTVDKSKYQDPELDYLNYITKSIHVSAFRLAELLADLSTELQSSRISNLSVGKAVRTKLKPEIKCLRNVLGKCLANDSTAEFDSGFVHVLLAFKSTEYLQQNLTPVDLCVLAETLRMVVSNLNFVNSNSSDDEDIASEDTSYLEKRNIANHVCCVLQALDKALTIAYNDNGNNTPDNDNNNSLRDHLVQLGNCTCCWGAKGDPKVESKMQLNTPASTKKYNKAFDFLNQTLFSEDRKREINHNKLHFGQQAETFIRQLTYEEDGEEVTKATLTLGNRTVNRLEVVEEEDKENDDDSFATAPSSVEDNMLTPEEGFKVFIKGCEGSKIDADILAAIEGMDINEKKFPHISQWLHLVSSHTEAERKSWRTPAHVRAYSSSVPRMSSNYSVTPPMQRRLLIPSSAPRILFGQKPDMFQHFPS